MQRNIWRAGLWLTACLTYSSSSLAAERLLWSGDYIPTVGGEFECLITWKEPAYPLGYTAYDGTLRELWQVKNEGWGLPGLSDDCRYVAYRKRPTGTNSPVVVRNAMDGKVVRRWVVKGMEWEWAALLPRHNGNPWALTIFEHQWPTFRPAILGGRYYLWETYVVRSKDRKFMWTFGAEYDYCDRFNDPDPMRAACDRINRKVKRIGVVGSTTALGAPQESFSADGRLLAYALLEPAEPWDGDMLSVPDVATTQYYLAQWSEKGINGIGKMIPMKPSIAFPDEGDNLGFLHDLGGGKYEIGLMKDDASILWKKEIAPFERKHGEVGTKPGPDPQRPCTLRFAKDKLVVNCGVLAEVYDAHGSFLGWVKLVYPEKELRGNVGLGYDFESAYKYDTPRTLYLPDKDRYIRMQYRKEGRNFNVEFFEGRLSETFERRP